MKIIRKADEMNGLEAWRLLAVEWGRESDTGALGTLDRLMHFDFGSTMTELMEKRLDFNLACTAYENQHPLEELPPGIQKAILIRGVPDKQLRTYLRVNAGPWSYNDLCAKIDDYMQSENAWGTMDDAVEEGCQHQAESQPMSVDWLNALPKGKGKGKGKGKMKAKTKGALTLTPVPGAASVAAAQQGAYDGYCLFCAQRGHRQQDCQYWREAATAVRQKLGTEWNPSACFRCGQAGHFASHCQSALALLEGETDDMDHYQEDLNEENAAWLADLQAEEAEYFAKELI